MDANAKLKAQSNNQIGNSSNTTNISLSKFLDVYLVTNFKSILPLTLYEIHEELNIEIPASLIGLEANMRVDNSGSNVGLKRSPQTVTKRHLSRLHNNTCRYHTLAMQIKKVYQEIVVFVQLRLITSRQKFHILVSVDAANVQEILFLKRLKEIRAFFHPQNCL